MAFTIPPDPAARVRPQFNERTTVRRNLVRREVRHALNASLTIALILGISIGLRTYVIGVYAIPSESMEPTIAAGDRIAVQMYYPEISAFKRGDIIVFTDPGGWLPPTGSPRADPIIDALRLTGIVPTDPGNLLVKRLVGLPGDRVICDASGLLTVNGVTVDETYVMKPNVPVAFDVTVPDGSLWVLGDNRGMSRDSRFNDVQFVPSDNVVGRAASVIWPIDRFQTFAD